MVITNERSSSILLFAQIHTILIARCMTLSQGSCLDASILDTCKCIKTFICRNIEKGKPNKIRFLDFC